MTPWRARPTLASLTSPTWPSQTRCATPCLASLGSAWLDLAWLGLAWLGLAWLACLPLSDTFLSLPCLCLVVSCLVLPWFALPCLALSCLAFPCLVLSCLASFFLVLRFFYMSDSLSLFRPATTLQYHVCTMFFALFGTAFHRVPGSNFCYIHLELVHHVFFLYLREHRLTNGQMDLKDSE